MKTPKHIAVSINSFPAMRYVKYIVLGICLFGCTDSYSQLELLRKVQHDRYVGQDFVRKEKYDSAHLAFGKFVSDTTYATPYDYLDYSLCSFKLNDTTSFLSYLNKAIEGGVDSSRIYSILKKITGNGKLYLDNYLFAHYEETQRKGWAQYDTALILEVISIEKLDWFARKEMMLLNNPLSDINYRYLAYLQKQADSINYVRVTRLFESGKFPGYHSCGAFASLTIVLMHLGDYHEEQWEYLFNRLKSEVLLGNIWPMEVATIADNHYQRGKRKHCSYYGQWTGRTTELCDCAQVDKYRRMIGLEDLTVEYTKKGKALPECYKALSPQQK